MISVVWATPREARATIVRETPSGQRYERNIGPRALLSLAEAAVVLERPPEEVRRAIRTGFLRACRRGRRAAVTFRACIEFLREEEYEGRMAKAAMEAGGPSIPAEEVYRQLGI